MYPIILKHERLNFFSYNFQIGQSKRIKGLATPRSKVIANFGAIRDYQLDQPEAQRRFWEKVDVTVQNLVTVKRLKKDDAQKIKAKYAEFIPRPARVGLPIPKREITQESALDDFHILLK